MNDISFELDSTINTRGTSKKGVITTTFNHLVDTFGKPVRSKDNSIHYEWPIRFEVPADNDPTETDFVIAVIYDWNLNVDPASRPGDKIEFNIGGHNLEAAYYVHLVLGE
mgnify:CR=1 FL=1